MKPPRHRMRPAACRKAPSGEIALSARLPIQQATFAPSRVLPYLKGLLPKNSKLRARWGRKLCITFNASFALLAAMGWDCRGAVQFSPSDQLDTLSARSHEYVAINESGIAYRLRTFGSQSASWTMPGEHWSLDDQQEKFALTHLDGNRHCAIRSQHC